MKDSMLDQAIDSKYAGNILGHKGTGGDDE